MVIDTSVLLAILCDEPERRRFNEAIEAADSRLLSVASYVEASIVTESRSGAEGVRALDTLIEHASLELVPVDKEQGRAARLAFSRFGKGRHSAGLNYGDCFVYALARVTGHRLLCKGADFSKTDLNLYHYDANKL